MRRSALLALGAGLAAFTLGMTTAAARPSLRVRTNVRYGTTSRLQVLDIYPASHAAAPIVILIHGGGWTSGNKNQLHTEARQLQANGITVFNINYRLASRTHSAFPMEINDVMAAALWAKAHAKQFNGNPNDITLIGGSAGAHLADIATPKLNSAHAHMISGTVSLSGPTDFVRLARDAARGSYHHPRIVSHALGCHLRSCPKRIEKAWSPKYQVSAKNCPSGGWLLFNSKREAIPADQATVLAKKLRKLACPERKTILPGTAHAMAYWSKVIRAIVQFVHHHRYRA